MMTSPDRYTPLPGFVTSAVALNQVGQPASINPKRAHKVVPVILKDKQKILILFDEKNHESLQLGIWEFMGRTVQLQSRVTCQYQSQDSPQSRTRHPAR